MEVSTVYKKVYDVVDTNNEEHKMFLAGLDMLARVANFDVISVSGGKSIHVLLQNKSMVEGNFLSIEYSEDSQIEMQFDVNTEYVSKEGVVALAEERCGDNEDCIERQVKAIMEEEERRLSCSPKTISLGPALMLEVGCYVDRSEYGISQWRYFKAWGKVIPGRLIWLIPGLWFIGLYFLYTYDVL